LPLNVLNACVSDLRLFFIVVEVIATVVLGSLVIGIGWVLRLHAIEKVMIFNHIGGEVFLACDEIRQAEATSRLVQI